MDSCKKQEPKSFGPKFNVKKLYRSIKCTPEIIKFLLKLRKCVRKKNILISSLKRRLKAVKQHNVSKQDNYTQTFYDNKPTKDTSNDTDEKYSKIGAVSEDNQGWNVNIEAENAVSIADQVKEVAQSALQQSGMVYVESAGMYYDYKTGYYYNSELGLYYHTDTNCYYYYSEEKKNFVFHSYPDQSKVSSNLGLMAHEKKKARKHKKDRKTEDDIDNLTKNLSQDKEEEGNAEGTKSKRRKTSKKTKASETPVIGVDDKHGKDKIQNGDQNVDMFEEKQTAGEKTEMDNAINENAKEELEDGECSGTDTEDSEHESLHDSTSTASDDDSIARHHPPCMRIIVKETLLPKLKVGSLFLITKDGGSIGREGDHHSIILIDQNISRNHLNITYDLTKRCYLAMDLGSKNGTILNGVRMSESQTVSKSLEIVHGSTLEMGETKLLCHIHPGTDTCGHCEPGLLMETQEKEKKVAYTRTCSVQKQHQLELARLKNKYAPKPLAIEATAYVDRAQTRRETVGSSHHSEKTQSSDIDTFIAPENKGFKLLEKMGWSKGEGLGKDNQGGTEPIPLISNEGKAGLGTGANPAPAPAVNKLGSATLRLASKSKLLKPPAKLFQQNDNEEESE